MASSFRDEQDVQVAGLLSRLVSTFLPDPPGTQNHDLAASFCLRNVTHHQFADVNPTEVDENYRRLDERLAAISQVQKLQGLQQLRGALMGQALPSNYLDPHHRLLSLLYWLQGQPLLSSFSPAGLEAIQNRSAAIPGTAAADQRAREEILEDLEGSLSGDGGSRRGGASPGSDSGSDLSEWSDVTDREGVEGSLEVPATPPEESTAAWQDSEGCTMADLNPPLSAAHEESGQMGLVQPERVGGMYMEGCLIQALEATRSAGLPLLGLPRHACTSEHDLMWEALRILRGLPGRTIYMDKGSGTFKLHGTAHMPDLSCKSLCSMLQDLVAAGNQMLRIREVVRYATSCSLGGAASRPHGMHFPVTPTVSALCMQLEASLEDACLPLRLLEADLKEEQEKGTLQPGLTLLQVRARLASTLDTTSLLIAVLDRVLPPGKCPAAECAATVLSGLYEMLQESACHAEPRREAVLLQLLVGAMEPYLRVLCTWLLHGLVDDAAEEFFVAKQGTGIPVTSADFWTKEFALRSPSPSGAPVIPSFLAEVAGGVLAAGKAVHLMGSVDAAIAQESALGEASRRRRVLAASAAAAANRGPVAISLQGPPGQWNSSSIGGGGSRSLHGLFASSLRDLLQKAAGRGEEGSAGRALAEAFRLKLESLFPSSSGSGGFPSREDSGGEKGLSGGDTSTPGAASRPPQLQSAVPVATPRTQASLSASGRVEGRARAAFHHTAAAWNASSISSAVELPAYTGAGDIFKLRRAGQKMPTAFQEAVVLQGLGSVAPRDIRRLPPPAILMEQCLLRPLTQQVEASRMQLMEQVMGPWGLTHELHLLRSFFLMGSAALEGFLSELLPLIAASPSCLTRMPPFEVEAMLKGSLPTSLNEPLPDADRLSVELELPEAPSKPALEDALQKGLPHIDILLKLHVNYKVTAPLELVLNDAALQVYTAALKFLLQLRWAKHSLDECRMALFRRVQCDQRNGGEEPARRLGFLDRPALFAALQEMMHFVTNLNQYVMDRNLFASWLEMEQALDTAASLDDVIKAHNLYLRKVQTHCLLLKEKYVRFMQEGVLHTLNHCLQWCHVLSSEIESDLCGEEGEARRRSSQAELRRLKADYDKSHRYLLKILGAIMSSQTGAYYGLEHLLMRLRYNDGTALHPSGRA
eukprot:CAMPEP_0117655852 /NCGR_PEP_ID=MMETSP0804-20121206/4497_1 /TAXON_ID=1074897 /ORGANISM="Tetraselmis astigmatica, Strain CCMP880" /LENGTH=1153 /DNA_ID=CAMNT_0005462225 /DNA_START=45 /DNA_END=3507 /DNA_ORIENTATION=-